MDLKPSSWHPGHFLDVLEIDLAEPLSHIAGEQAPRNFHRTGIRPASKSEELDHLKARLRTIGLDVGRD